MKDLKGNFQSKIIPLLLLTSMGINAGQAFYIAKITRSGISSELLNTSSSAKTVKGSQVSLSEVNPDAGYEINATFEDLGPRMIAMGVIDLEKFKAAYSASGLDLDQEQLDILTKGSNSKVKITSLNSKFLLNFFWAVGLANKTSILDKGEIMKYGGIKGVGSFASTGGWTLAKGDAVKYFSKSKLINLTPEQEKLVNEVASNIYRPCCDNSTAFPDCNHGMALLGVLELMAANGASEDDMYQVSKYFNAFWFPGNYTDLALYFKNKEGKDFKDIDPKVLLSKEFSSATGWQTAKAWLGSQGIIELPKQQGGGGCGV